MPIKVDAKLRPWAALRSLASEFDDIDELFMALEDAGFEVATRYGTGADALPDPQTMCPGSCEGMGCVPIMESIMGPDWPKKSEVGIVYDQEHVDKWRDAWAEAEAKAPADDGWHFLTCPDCQGTGERISTMSPDKEAIQQAVGEAASIHWPASEEVFDSSKASEIADELAEKLGVTASVTTLSALEEYAASPQFFNEWLDNSTDGISHWLEQFNLDAAGLDPEELKRQTDERIRELFDKELERTMDEIYGVLSSDPIDLWRVIDVPDPKDFLWRLSNEETIEGYDSIGPFWSFEKATAMAHWSQGGTGVRLHGQVALEDVDLVGTLTAQMDPDLGDGEDEIRLMPGAPVRIVEATVEGEDVPLDHPVVMTARKIQALRAGKKTLVFDFDGTIAEEREFPEIGPPIFGTIERMRAAMDAGIEVVIQSCRWSEHELSTAESAAENLVAAKAWLEANEVPYDRLAAGKPLAEMYVDDRACHVNDLQKLDQMIMELASEFPVEGSVSIDTTEGHDKFWISPEGEFFGGLEEHDLEFPGDIHFDDLDEVISVGWVRGGFSPKGNLWFEMKDESKGSWAISRVPTEMQLAKTITINNTEVPVLDGEDAAAAWSKRKDVRHRMHASLKILAFGDNHEWGCLMLEAPEELADEVLAWGKKNIPDEDLFIDPENPKDNGRENQIHTTVSYGIDPSTDPGDIQFAIFQQRRPVQVKLGAISKFDKDDCDVIKIDVISHDMERMHREIEENLETPGNTFPDYRPHITIAYVKKGSADKLIGQDPFAGREFELTKFDYGYPPAPGEKDVHKHYDLNNIRTAAGVRASVVRADKFTDLRKAALRLIEDDPAWKQLIKNPASAQAYGELEKAVQSARSEDELRAAWEANMDLPWETVAAEAGGRAKP